MAGEDAPRSSSLRGEPAPSLSLSARRQQKISRTVSDIETWLAQIEMWELGHPPESAASEASQAARKLQFDPPPPLPLPRLLRWLMFDPPLLNHPLILRLLREKTLSLALKPNPPKVPDWWGRTRSPKEAEEWVDRCRSWKEILALRQLRADSLNHPIEASSLLDPRYLRGRNHLPPPPSRSGAPLKRSESGIVLPFARTKNT